MSARLEPREVLGLVARSAVAMTGGSAGAIAIREDRTAGLIQRGTDTPRVRRSDGRVLRLVASYHLEPHLVELLRAGLVGPNPSADENGERPGADRAASEGGYPVGDPVGMTLDDSAEGIGGGTVERLARWYDELPLRADDDVDPESDLPRRVLTIPLVLRGEEIGQIMVLRGQTAAAFTPLEDELLRAFADQAAVAIQNALLHARLAASERRLAAVVSHSAAGILLVDEAGRVIRANPAGERLLGLPSSRIVGRPLAALMPLFDALGRPVAVDLPQKADASGSVRGRLADRSGTGHALWVQVSVTPLATDGDAAEGYVVNISDLTAWREAERAKTAFLAGLSHELKTPLSLIKGFAETLANPAMPADEAFGRQALGVILEETDRLTRMVDQLLLTARMESGALRLELDQTDVGALVERLVDELRVAHPDRKIDLEIDADAQPIRADAARLRQMVAELLANALKYAPESRAPIGVRVARDPAPTRYALRIEVRDRGPGIAAEDAPHVFERFYRASERGVGTGLGLYMCRVIVEAHGGRVDLETEPGSGSTFVVRLPADPGLAAAPRLSPPADLGAGDRPGTAAADPIDAAASAGGETVVGQTVVGQDEDTAQVAR